MIIPTATTAVLLLAAQAAAYAAGPLPPRDGLASPLERRSCGGVSLTMYTKADCSDPGTVACTIPECAQAASTNAPVKWIAFKYNAIAADAGCDPNDLLFICDNTGTCDSYSLSAVKGGACHAVFTAVPGDYIASVQLNAATKCSCIKAFGAISPQGPTCPLGAKTCSPASCGNGSGLCI